MTKKKITEDQVVTYANFLVLSITGPSYAFDNILKDVEGEFGAEGRDKVLATATQIFFS